MDKTREEQYKATLTAARDKIRELAAENAVLKKRESAHGSSIAVVGMACEFPGGGNSYEAFNAMLLDGTGKIDKIPSSRWDNARFYDSEAGKPGRYYCELGSFLDRDPFAFDNAFFGLGEAEAKAMDPQQRLLLAQSWHALEDAGIPPSELRGTDAGVFLGISSFDYLMAYSVHALANHSDPYSLTGSTFNAAAGRLSYFYDIHGPSTAIDTACSSSLAAIYLAVKALRDGECPVALAGGANLLLSPLSYVALSSIRGISRDGKSRAFGDEADGFSRGEGAGMVILKRLDDAITAGDRIHALILGGALGHDGQSAGFTAPSGPAQERIIRRALDNADVSPNDIAYIETHGTGTQLGDQIELSALSGIFGKREHPLFIGSVKSNIGHLEAAAGVASFIKTVLAVGKGVIPPSLHTEQLSSTLDWNSVSIEVCRQQTAWPQITGRRLAGVSSFGISGSGAHIVLCEAPKPDTSAEQSSESFDADFTGGVWRVLPLSAKHEDSLRKLSTETAGLLTENTGAFYGICDKAGCGRDHFPHRLALIAEDSTGAHTALSGHLDGKRSRALITGKAKNSVRTAFVFSGQGSQTPGMGKELYRSAPPFRDTLDTCERIARKRLGHSLLDVMFGDNNARLNQTLYTQPAIFAMEAGLVDLWRSFGIRPSVVIGHSIGEYAAAYAAGVFSIEDGMDIVLERAVLADGVDTPGGMAAVLTTPDDIHSHIGHTRVDIAAVNGDDNLVISGPADEMSGVLASLYASGIEYRKMPVSHAFHSSLIEPVLDDYRTFLRSGNFRKPSVKFISSMLAAPVDGTVNWPDYWCDQMRRSVRFSETLAAMDNADVFLEIGASPTLTSLCRGLTGDVPWLFSQGPGIPSWKQIALTLAKLYVAGCPVDFGGGVFGRSPEVDFPLYPFNEKILRPDGSPDMTDTSPETTDTAPVASAEPVEAPATPSAAKVAAMQQAAMRRVFARQRETLERLGNKDSIAHD